MVNNCNNTQPQRILRGVTRSVYITLVDGAGSPVDLTQAESVVATVSLDGASSQWAFHPVLTIGGEGNNVVSFVWYADQQVRCGRYTIDVTADFGERMVSRVDWHRQFGVELVEHSVDVSGATTPKLETEGDIELTGNLVITTAGESALEEWILSPESEGYPKTEEGFFAWMRQPAVDAETTVEANEAERVIAEQGRVQAEQGRVQAESTRETVFRADHLRAIEDHDTAAADHSRATQDHNTAAADHAAAVTGATVSVDDTSGTPSATATVENNTLSIAFSGLKGADGQPGARGQQGNPGSSSAYPFELVNNTKTNDATKGLTAAQGYDLALRPLSEWALDGAGNTFVSISWTGVMPGHKYRFWIKFWPNSEVTQHGENYAQCVIWKNSSASKSNALAGAYGNETVAPLYDVEAPSDCTTLILGGRINSGAEGIVFVEDVTLLTTKLNQLDQKVGIIGTNQNGFYLVDSSRRIAAQYDADGFDVAKLSAHFQSLINVQQAVFVDTIEDGFFIVDENLYIGFAITEDGIVAKNTVSARIVTL